MLQHKVTETGVESFFLCVFWVFFFIFLVFFSFEEQCFVYLLCPLWKSLKLMMLVFSSVSGTWLSFCGAKKLRLRSLSQHCLRKEREEKC